MKIAVDANVLVRVAVLDDMMQVRVAERTLKAAETVFVSLTCLCEFVWVLRRVYRFTDPLIADALETLLRSTNIVTDWPAVEAGLRLLRNGGDFADGVIAYQGRWAGAEQFVSFDRRAVGLLQAQGFEARLLK